MGRNIITFYNVIKSLFPETYLVPAAAGSGILIFWV